MKLYEERASQPGLDVGYIITYTDGRTDKFGLFPFTPSEPGYFSIFKKLFELEPSVKEASYIYSSLRVAPNDREPQTIEYRQSDFRRNLRWLARTGSVCRF